MSEATYDVIVIGAGLVGSAAARHISKENQLVCLIGPEEPKVEEKLSREIFGCHYDEGRITRVFALLPESSVLNQISISRYQEIKTLSGIDFYNPVGCIYAGTSGAEWVECAQKALKNEEFGLVNITDNVKKRFPYLSFKSDETVVLEPKIAGYINPRRLVEAQKLIAQKQGCQIVDEVVDEVQETISDDGQVVMKVRTESGKILKSKKVLLCTNSFTNFKKLLPVGRLVQVECQRTQTLLLAIPSEEVDRLKDMPPIIYRREDIGVYILPPIFYPNGKWYVKVGLDFPSNGTNKNLEEMKHWFNSHGDNDVRDKLKDIIIQIIPGLNVLATEDMVCSTCSSPTRLPYIDIVTPSLGVTIAGNGNSAKSSDELGRLGVHLITHGVWDSVLLPREHFKIIWK